MKSLLNTINEARAIKYRVSFLGCTDREGLPVSADILVDASDARHFEAFLEQEEGNIFEHAEGGDVEY